MTINTLPDIAGTNTTVRLSSTPGKRARHVYLTSIGGLTRWGDSNTGVAQGNELPSGASVIIYANEADPTDLIDLYNLYVYVASGATLTVSYA